MTEESVVGGRLDRLAVAKRVVHDVAVAVEYGLRHPGRPRRVGHRDRIAGSIGTIGQSAAGTWSTTITGASPRSVAASAQRLLVVTIPADPCRETTEASAATGARGSSTRYACPAPATPSMAVTALSSCPHRMWTGGPSSHSAATEAATAPAASASRS